MLYRIFTLLILLLAAPAWGSNYYVDCNAAADGDGSLSTPWDALSDVAGASFSAGDNVYFARGCTWNGSLVIPSSGSDGLPITFGAYGSGAKPILQSATEDYVILATTKTWLVFDNLDVRGSDTYGAIVLLSAANNNVVQNCNAQDTTTAGMTGCIWIYQSSGNTITRNTVSNCPQGIAVVDSDSNTISYNTVTTSTDYGIVVNTGSANNIIEHNEAYSNAGTDDRAAIGAYNPGAGNVFRYNYAHHNGDASHKYCGFWVDGDGAEEAVTFHHNISAYNTGGGYAATGNVVHIFSHNTAYKNSDASHDYGEINLFYAGENAQGYLIRNNIFVADTGKYLLRAGENQITGHTLNYNLWYGGSATPFEWGTSAYNFSNYKTASSQDANSVNSDPLLNDSYGLAGNSPAKDAGAVLYTYAAHPGDFIGAKVYGSAPDIGAIEYKDHTFGGWFFEMFIPTIFNLCASTNANCYIQP